MVGSVDVAVLGADGVLRRKSKLLIPLGGRVEVGEGQCWGGRVGV